MTNQRHRNSVINKKHTFSNKSQQNCQQQLANLKQELLKALADFQNYQKRVEQRKQQEHNLLKRDVFKDIITLFENLHIALENLSKEIKEHSEIKGIILILEQYKDILKKHGVQEITYKVGDVPDISATEIIGTQPADNKQNKKGTVAQLVTPGYKIGDIVIKPARVIVWG